MLIVAVLQGRINLDGTTATFDGMCIGPTFVTDAIKNIHFHQHWTVKFTATVVSGGTLAHCRDVESYQ